ncbi:T6SS phospholipase effector Tle1-like catalytic domain-containing protein [Pseudomonas sp.]|uniref:T6SS phospholipase effector Tle1-like catalytic domain-containing protein n=1 Tax=Pseudomonas sp. TaxID=306 RepID=UPI003D0BEEA1
MPHVCRPALPNSSRERRPTAKRSGERQPLVNIQRERWEAYEKYGREPAPAPSKTRVALRIGVFFDGTGNNASNTATGLLCGAQHPIAPADLDASCKPYMSDPDSSYGNDVTNIRKLSDLYHAPEHLEGDNQHKQAFRKIYIEGIGTRAGEKDSLLSLGTGRGMAGVAERVQQAFNHIKLVIQNFRQTNPDCEISSLTFDTFGFSRGAAAARHFANELVRGKHGPLGDMLLSNEKAFSPFFIDQYPRDINTGFIGLFDTVASIVGLTNLGNVRSSVVPGLRLYLPRKYFSSVVHLVARDEYRANFALSRVKPEHPEITLPGAHSDIGGGYLPEAEECLLISPMQALDVALHIDVTNTSIYRDAEQARAQWLANGWPAEMLEIITPEPKLLSANQDRNAPRQKRVYAALQLKRPVRGELSRVYLRVMYELAKRKGVRFIDIPEEPEYLLPVELQSLCDRFIAGDYNITSDDDVLLKLKYIHVSAHWNPPARLQGNTPRTGGKLKFINAPTADAQRVQHPHVPEWTLR